MDRITLESLQNEEKLFDELINELKEILVKFSYVKADDVPFGTTFAMDLQRDESLKKLLEKAIMQGLNVELMQMAPVIIEEFKEKGLDVDVNALKDVYDEFLSDQGIEEIHAEELAELCEMVSDLETDTVTTEAFINTTEDIVAGEGVSQETKDFLKEPVMNNVSFQEFLSILEQNGYKEEVNLFTNYGSMLDEIQTSLKETRKELQEMKSQVDSLTQDKVGEKIKTLSDAVIEKTKEGQLKLQKMVISEKQSLISFSRNTVEKFKNLGYIALDGLYDYLSLRTFPKTTIKVQSAILNVVDHADKMTEAIHENLSQALINAKNAFRVLKGEKFDLAESEKTEKTCSKLHGIYERLTNISEMRMSRAEKMLEHLDEVKSKASLAHSVRWNIRQVAKWEKKYRDRLVTGKGFEKFEIAFSNAMKHEELKDGLEMTFGDKTAIYKSAEEWGEFVGKHMQDLYNEKYVAHVEKAFESDIEKGIESTEERLEEISDRVNKEARIEAADELKEANVQIKRPGKSR